jgi:hypothetical protein
MWRNTLLSVENLAWPLVSGFDHNLNGPVEAIPLSDGT